ncbi:TonB-dependent receptor [Methylobacterium nodulans]|uniref:TonB-dependent receptor n=1 Tax=Methylobacterium nodulans (strain LMG 21967 / CNCM I-2342 / ORS 2060) TaxID=460265 RepID=B8ILX7_METNO|nr:TonB-dependent receptor [Methylobacterium nodulans]ACL56321.1 TonB-dependent receptor [Methylobacterium nodulans ORS 2060]
MPRRLRPLALALLGGSALSTVAAGQERAEIALDQIVVTATGRPEPRSEIAGTVQVIDRTMIETSTAKSVTDLLAENAVGFFSEWTPGQTSINIRGGATDGQGKDFKSQVLVLMNGRRAGTANLSKLSIADIERIEIVRGPSSVIYGSQNIGGVINIILKTGRTAPGTLVEGIGGVWGLAQGRAQTGGVVGPFDYYLGLSGAKRDDYFAGTGGGRMANTQWNRMGITGGLGLQIDPNNRLDFTLRTDGIYGVGFRGSGGNIYSKDDRINGSFDASYTGRSDDGRMSLFAQLYSVNDEDRFKWASPIQRGGTGLPVPGTSADFNTRYLDILGTRFQPRFNLFTGNDLLLGWDWETSRLRSDRFRAGVPGNPLAQVSPQDNNQTDQFHALYIEDTQRLFDDRVTLRAGVRRTYGTTSFDPTPYLTAQVNGTRPYEATTYSVGAAFKATDWAAFRIGASSGFRAPTASELAADFNTLGGGRIFGNPNIRPETSEQVEIGTTLTSGVSRLDVALFQNVISDRIITRARGRNSNTSDYVNNPGDVVIRGMEVQYETDMVRTFGWEPGVWRWRAYVNGNYNFDMKDKGAVTVATANTHRVERVYLYQLALGTRFGQGDVAYPWTLQIQGELNGPVWYNTEENLRVPAAEPYREYIWRKDPFFLVHLRGEVDLMPGVKLFAQVRNLFDVNYHPLFIAIAGQQPTLADLRFYNGSGGTSAPGRDVQIGLQARF